MRVPSSFRDPNGFLFWEDDTLYRQVNPSCHEDYDCLMDSGLYRTLVDKGLLISHSEVDTSRPKAYKVLRPELIPFVSYPYEWCFSQLKGAALTTLEAQREALEHGMTLKDASAYNVQFRNGRPILIDTLSFTRHVKEEPWVAYKQFCEHFLGPLALTKHKDARLSRLLELHIDGIPLDLVSSLLPRRTLLKFSLLTHIHLHSRFQSHYTDKPRDPPRMKRSRLTTLVDNLKAIVGRMSLAPPKHNYYRETNYSARGFEHKESLVEEYVGRSKPTTIWDLGANIGKFSKLASSNGALTISIDGEPSSVETNYLECVREERTNILPLVADLTNPSPHIGWAGSERMSLIERGPADTVLMLALVHHLTISNNLPLDMIAGFLDRVCRQHLVIEFIPKSDSQVQRLLATRDDIFSDYTRECFEVEFRKRFRTLDSTQIVDSHRVLYLMEKL